VLGKFNSKKRIKFDSTIWIWLPRWQSERPSHGWRKNRDTVSAEI